MTKSPLLSILLALALALAWAPPGARAQNAAFAPAAFVDDKVISYYDVDQRAKLLAFIGRPKEQAREQALESMIQDKLKRIAAERIGLAASRADVDAGMARFAQRGGVTPAQLAARLRKAGVSVTHFREFIEAEVLWTSLVRQQFAADNAVADTELDDEIKAEGLDRKIEFRISEISMPAGNDPAAAMEKARRIVAEARAGADFAALARKHSLSPTRAKGGDVGWIDRDRIPPSVAAAIGSLEVGGVADPIPVPGGVAILSLRDKREQKRELSDEDREAIRSQMLERRLTRLADARLAELRARAYVDIR